MPSSSRKPNLYGMTSTNSNRTDSNLWGKNQFNSTFPLALCLKLRDDNIKPVYVALKSEGVNRNRIIADDTLIDLGEVIGEQKDDKDLFYSFEEKFKAYTKFFRNVSVSEKIDLVVLKKGKQLNPLEIKLTVVPDSITSKKQEDEWAPELVIRPVTSAYAIMGIAYQLHKASYKKLKEDVIGSLENIYKAISDWKNVVEILKHKEALADALKHALEIVYPVQRPFLLQPIWRTQGQSAILSEQCFDVFVWSDAAVVSIPTQRLAESTGGKVSRPLREIARHVRALYNLLTTEHFNYTETYGGEMTLGHQTDKAFAISGEKTRKYLAHPRLTKPYYNRSILNDIILGNGYEELRPERRFDAAVVRHFLTHNKQPRN